jgi:hypothetical protein
MRAFKAAVITLEIGFLMAAFCGFIVAASDNIQARRKAAEDARKFNADIDAMARIQKEMPR